MKVNSKFLALCAIVDILIIIGLIYYYWHLNESFEDLPNLMPKNNYINYFGDIQHVLVINLDERPDRLSQINTELGRLGLLGRTERVSAVKTTPGKLGCTLSHIKCLKMAKRNGWSHVMICEDDLLFAKDVNWVKQRFNTMFERHKTWDMITLGVIILSGEYLDDSTAQLKKAGSTTCYIVRKEYYDVLLHNFKYSAKRLRQKQPDSEIDVIWQTLQKRDRWLTILPLIAIQRPSYSDIEQNQVDYKPYHMKYENIENYPEVELLKNNDTVFE